MPLAAPLIMGGLAAAGTIGGAMISSNAAGKAADLQSQAAGNQLAFAKNVYNQNQSNMAPYMGLGSNATKELSDIYGFASGGPSSAGALDSFLQTPDYRFSFDQGSRALDMSAASRHLLTSGGMVRAAQDYGSGAAGQQFGNVVQRLMAMINTGKDAAASAGMIGNQAAGMVNNAFGAQGQAAASGVMGQANPWVSALNTGPGNTLAAASYFSPNNPNSPFGSSGYTQWNPLSWFSNSPAMPGAPMNLNPNMAFSGGSTGALY